MQHYWLEFFVDDRHRIPYECVIHYHMRQLAPALMYPSPPSMVHLLKHRFAQPPLHAPAPAPPLIHLPPWIFGPPSGLGPIPAHGPPAPWMVVLSPLRVIILIFHHHHPRPPPPLEQHLVALIIAPVALVPDLEEDHMVAAVDHMVADDDDIHIVVIDVEDHMVVDVGHDEELLAAMNDRMMTFLLWIMLGTMQIIRRHWAYIKLWGML